MPHSHSNYLFAIFYCFGCHILYDFHWHAMPTIADIYTCKTTTTMTNHTFINGFGNGQTEINSCQSTIKCCQLEWNLLQLNEWREFKLKKNTFRIYINMYKELESTWYLFASQKAARELLRNTKSELNQGWFRCVKCNGTKDVGPMGETNFILSRIKKRPSEMRSMNPLAAHRLIEMDYDRFSDCL